MAQIQKLLVTGATGMVGTGLLRHALSEFPDLQILGTHFHTEPFVRDSRIHYVQADLTSKAECERVVADCDAAILASAVTGGVAHGTKNPERQMTDNLVMDTLMLQALFDAKIRRVVYLSSATVYQESERPLTEEALDLNQDPHPTYLGVGWAKRSAEKLCHFWNAKKGMEILILRCSGVYGPFAAMDPARSNFIPALIRKAEEKMDPFEVWGTPDVERDVLFVDDLARASFRALHQKDISFDTFNIGAGKTVAVSEVVNTVLSGCSFRPKNINFVSDRPQAIKVRSLDCSKAKTRLNWQATTSLSQGVKATREWWQEWKERWKK